VTAAAASRDAAPPTAPTAVELSLDDLSRATDGFAGGKQIGAGGFGRVFVAAAEKLPLDHPLSALPAHLRQAPLAVKRARSGRQSGLTRALMEVKLLKAVEHPHLLPLLGYCLDEKAPCLISPLMRGGSLALRLRPSEADAVRRDHGWHSISARLTYHGGHFSYRRSSTCSD
jgi:serine/threonine protein kinase